MPELRAEHAYSDTPAADRLALREPAITTAPAMPTTRSSGTMHRRIRRHAHAGRAQDGEHDPYYEDDVPLEPQDEDDVRRRAARVAAAGCSPR